MHYLLIFIAAFACGIAAPILLFWLAIHIHHRREDEVLRHLPIDLRETARPHLNAVVGLLWPGSPDLKNRLKAQKEAFLTLYKQYPGVAAALDKFVSDAIYEREKARGRPLYRGLHTIE